MKNAICFVFQVCNVETSFYLTAPSVFYFACWNIKRQLAVCFATTPLTYKCRNCFRWEVHLERNPLGFDFRPNSWSTILLVCIRAIEIFWKEAFTSFVGFMIELFSQFLFLSFSPIRSLFERRSLCSLTERTFNWLKLKMWIIMINSDYWFQFCYKVFTGWIM